MFVKKHVMPNIVVKSYNYVKGVSYIYLQLQISVIQYM
jgi:hypothetical protein